MSIINATNAIAAWVDESGINADGRDLSPFLTAALIVAQADGPLSPGERDQIAQMHQSLTGSELDGETLRAERDWLADNGVDAAIDTIGRAYKQAIEQSGVKRVIHLSSIGAHTGKGNGILAFHYNVEQLLNQLPADVSIKFMRPVGFYYNMFAFIPTIRAQHAIISNYGCDEKEPWVAPADIAAVIAEEMEKPFEGRSIRYIASDELSPNEVAGILGNAIGMPDLTWKVIPDQEFLDGLIAAGMNPQIAKGFMEMNAARRNGLLYEDYNRHRPVPGKTKVKDFAKEFAAVYNQQ